MQHQSELQHTDNPTIQSTSYWERPRDKSIGEKWNRQNVRHGRDWTPQREWESPIVFISKKDSTLHFCIHYQKLNTLRTRDLYLSLHMAECIDFIGNAAVFSVLLLQKWILETWNHRRQSRWNSVKVLSMCLPVFAHAVWAKNRFRDISRWGGRPSFKKKTTVFRVYLKRRTHVFMNVRRGQRPLRTSCDMVSWRMHDSEARKCRFTLTALINSSTSLVLEP